MQNNVEWIIKKIRCCEGEFDELSNTFVNVNKTFRRLDTQCWFDKWKPNSFLSFVQTERRFMSRTFRLNLNWHDKITIIRTHFDYVAIRSEIYPYDHPFTIILLTWWINSSYHMARMMSHFLLLCIMCSVVYSLHQ